MMKRVLSLLLCLTMVLGFAVPTVQASGTDDIYISDDSLSNVIVGDNIQMDNVVIDGESLTSSAEPTVPGSIIPGNAANADQVETSPIFAETGPVLPAEVVDLFPEGSASETYVDGTTVSVDGIPEDGSLSIQEASDAVKEIVADYAAEQSDTAVELFSYDISVQDARGEEWQPTGTVMMELEMPNAKLHKYSKVYVVHVDDNGVASTIEAEVTEDGKVAFETPGFSTFAGFTVDFEYNGEAFSIKGLTEILVSQVMDTLKMPLYIEDVADVTFTDETLVSVTAVEGDWLLTSLQAFQTEEKLTLTMNDGTVYEIKVTDAITTKADFYAAYYGGGAYSYIDGYTAGGNAVVQLFLDSDGYPQSNDSAVDDIGDFDTQPLVIDGRDVGGCMEIVLQKEDGAGNNLVWDLVELKIINGAKVVIRLGASFTGSETITINSVRPYTNAARPLFNIQDGSLYFNLGSDEASLCTGTGMDVTSTSSVKQIIFDGNDLGASASVPLIYTHRGVDETDRQNLVVRGVTFRDAKHRAVLVQTNNMNNLYFSNCTFESTVRDVEYGGGAIYIDGGTDGSTSNVVDVANFTLLGCTFSGNSGASGHGGAIASYGDIYKLYVKDCTFSNCTSANRGGAIELSVNDKTASNNIYNWIKFENTTFTNCTASSHGGAIDISNGDNPLYLAAGLTIDGCTFTNCKATGNRGGAIRMVVGDTARNLTITNSGFSGCTAGSNGGAISVQGIIGNVSISGYKTDANGNYTFRSCSTTDFGGALTIECTSGCGNISMSNAVITGNTALARGGGVSIVCPTVGDITLSASTFSNNTAGTIGGGFFVGIRASATAPITVGDVKVTGSTFFGNKSNGVGACLSLTDGTYNSLLVQNCSFSDSYAANYGGGIALKVYADDATEKFPVKVTNNVHIYDSTFTNCTSGGLNIEGYDHDGDPSTELKTTWDHDGNPDTAEITRLNGVGGGGAIAIGAEIGGTIEIKSTGSQNAQNPDAFTTKFINCGTWNNGGAVCLLGTVKTTRVDVAYVLFDGCRSRDAGGAFYLSNCIVDDLKMDACTIRNCSYFDPDDDTFTIDIPGTDYDSLGEATYAAYDASGTFRCIGNTTCRALIYNCTFRNNRSYSNGGGIYWNANNIRTGAGGSKITPSLQVQFCNLDGNYAARDGGGLYVEATVNVEGSWFQNNIADGRGGAIAQQVYNNEARTLGSGEATNLNLNSATLIHDNRANHGGGISITVSKTVSVPDGTNFIYPVQFTLGGAQVYDNKAITNGGGIYYATTRYDGDALGQREVDNFEKLIQLNDGKIYNNIAGYSNEEEGITSKGGSGGGVYMDSNQITTADSLTDGTKTGYSKVTISSGSIYNNIAYSGNGGGIYLQGKNALCSVSGGTIGFYRDANKAIVKYPNKAIPKETVTTETVDGKEVTTTTYSLGNGGGIAIYNGGRIEMTGGEICYNEAYVGGGIAVREGSSMLSDVDPTTKTAVLIDSNTATSAGGGIAIHGDSTMTMNGGTITNNTAAHGGAISVMSSGDPTTIRPVDDEGNSITTDAEGNPIEEKWGMIFNGGLVQYNLSTTLGGGICLSDNSTMQFNDGQVKNNWAAIREEKKVTNEDGTEDIEVTYTYTENVHDGGGIAVCQGSLMDIYGGTIEENNSYRGGGIVVRGAATLNMFPASSGTDGIIQKNTAVNGGGLGIAENCTVSIEGGSILNNEAQTGGGIWIMGDKDDTYGAYTTILNITGGSITGNEANGKEDTSGQGGGIYADYFCDITVAGNDVTDEAGIISENTSYKGGGVYLCNGACLTLKDGHLINNRAQGTCSENTTLNKNDGLKGVGGGVFVANGYDDNHPSTFTLTGEDIAIYGNIADFAADDVFSNGNKTKLNVKQVKQMNLAGYEFSPEAWFEDYCINEVNYSSGTNQSTNADYVTDGKVYRYRGATALHRVQIKEEQLDSVVNVADAFVCMTLGIPAAEDDTVVIDYGLPVKINVLDNDVILNLSELQTSGVISANGPSFENNEKIYNQNGIIYGEGLDSNFTEGTVELNLPHGVAKLDKTEGYVSYQLNNNDLIMDSYDSLWYAVYHKSAVQYEGKPEGYYYYAQVQIIPATTIYFEDNFGTAIDYSDNWVDTNTPYDLTDLRWAQSQDRIGESGDVDLDADNVYGFDPRYDNMYNYSFGSAKKVKVSEGNDASAVFTFTGTGFDIISHCSKKTGTILVNVYEGTEVDSSKLATTYMVDTYYGYTLNYYKLTYTYGNNGWTVESESITKNQMGESQKFPETPKAGDVVVVYQSKFEPASGSVTGMYQVPVMKTDMTQVVKSKDDPETEDIEPTVYYTYGTYTVEIYVAWSWWADHEQYGYGSWDFYLDGIRIYNPAGDGVFMDANGEVNTVIRDAYVADNEGWPRYEELRNLMISANEFSSINDSNVSGSIFIDTNAGLNAGSEGTTTFPDGSALSGKLPAIVDYANLGPNNELYLTDGQGIAFHLDTGAADLPEGVEIASVQIGLKSCSGNSSAKVYNASTTTFADAPFIDLNSTSDRYYDITTMDGGDVVIYCSSAYSCMSITNVKITYTADPYGTASGNFTGGSGSTTPTTGQIFTISADSARNALSSFLTEEETVPTLTLKYPTLSFEGEICYDIFFDAQDLGSLTAADMGLAVFTTEDTEGTVDTAYDVIYGTQLMDGLYMVSTNGIAAKDMGDRLYFKAFAKLSDGSYVYSDMRSYSALDYAQNALATSTDVAQKALVVAMLNYGAQAQTFFGHNTDSLMNAGLTAEDQTLVSGFNASTLNALTPADATKTAAFVANGGFSGKYPAVFFDGAFEINYNVIPENAVEGSMILYCWSEDTYNSADALTVENADQAVLMLNTDGVWSACSQQIAAKDLDKTVYAAAVYESQGESFCTGILPYSIATYCQDLSADTTSDMGALANAAAIYGCAAKAYFG